MPSAWRHDFYSRSAVFRFATIDTHHDRTASSVSGHMQAIERETARITGVFSGGLG
jgi:hypothetical protein